MPGKMSVNPGTDIIVVYLRRIRVDASTNLEGVAMENTVLIKAFSPPEPMIKLRVIAASLPVPDR